MRLVVWLILLCVVAVVAAMSLGANDGLVSLYWRGWRLDLSLNLFILGLIGTAVAVGGSVRFTRWLAGLPGRAKAWREGRREQALQAAQRESLIEYTAARYSRAVKAAERALELQSDLPAPLGAAQAQAQALTQALSRLMAALALHRLRDPAARDEQVRRIEAEGAGTPSLQEGLALLKAEWALEDHDARACLQHLEQLPPGVGRRIQAQRLRLQAHRLAAEPAEALRAARLLAKHQAFRPEAAQSLLRTLAIAVLDTAREGESLQTLWMELEREDRQDAAVLAHAVSRAARLGVPAWGRRVLRGSFESASALPSEQRERLALALWSVSEGVESEWLALVEPLANRHPREEAVLVAAAAVFAERQLWGKAQPLLEQSARSSTLSAEVRRDALRRLAQLALDRGDESRAAQCFRQAAEIR